MKERNTFIEVLCNCDDQVAVRDILNSTLTDKQKDGVVILFNIHVRYRNEASAALALIKGEEINNV